MATMRAAAALVPLMLLLLSGCAEAPANELQALLHKRAFQALEARLSDLHGQYLRGEISDIELRLRYRAFDAMSPEAGSALDDWVRAAPHSYFALSTRGYHHRSLAFWARGAGLARDLGSVQWAYVQRQLTLAAQDMRASLPLAARPIISHYVLLDTAGLPCDRDGLVRHFEAGIAAVPRSALLYHRYLHYLKPRWCGSAEKMAELQSRAVAQGLPPAAVQQMRAIQADDAGRSLLERQRPEEGERLLLEAAELGDPYGWAFRRESLFAVNEYACRLASLKRFCRA